MFLNWNLHRGCVIGSNLIKIPYNVKKYFLEPDVIHFGRKEEVADKFISFSFFNKITNYWERDLIMFFRQYVPFLQSCGNKGNGGINVLTYVKKFNTVQILFLEYFCYWPSNIPKSRFYNTIFPKLYLAMEVVVLLWVVSVSNNNKILSCTAFTWHPYKRVFAQRKNTSMVNDSLMIFLSRLLACRHTVLQDKQFTALKSKNSSISANFLKITLC